MVKKSAGNKGNKATAQAAPEAVTTATPTIENLTPKEQEFLAMIRSGKQIMDEEKSERDARIDAAAERLKSLKSDKDLDKALDFIDRISGNGGHFRSSLLNHETAPVHTFHQLSLHLACALWQDWFDSDELFETDEPGENEKADLATLVPYINGQIWEAVKEGKIDDSCLIGVINQETRHYHVEWVDDRGVPIWLGSDNLKERAARESDE